MVGRLSLLALFYIFCFQVVAAIRREQQVEPVGELTVGVLRVVSSDFLAPRTRLPLCPITTVGRAADNHLILEDPLVSRHHLRLAYQGGQWLVTDLATRNGTWVDGILIHDHPAPLPAGGELRLGGTTLQLTA